MAQAKPHSITAYFSEAARREAAFAHYEPTEFGPRAWSDWDQDWVFDALGLMAHADGLDKVAVPDPVELALALRERLGLADPPSFSRVPDLQHFARNFDAGKYRRCLPTVLGFKWRADEWHNLVHDVPGQLAERRQRRAAILRSIDRGVQQAMPLARRSVVRVENRVARPRPTVAVHAVARAAREVSR